MVWLTLKNITTATETKKLDAKQIKYTILENMGFHNFRFDTPPNIHNVFHVDKLRAASKNLLPSQIFDDNYPGPTIIGNENGAHEYDVEKILKKKGRSYQYLVKCKNYIRFIWEPTSIMKNTVALDEFETKFNWKRGNLIN